MQMSNELWHNFGSSETLYAIRFQQDGDVFITSGASDETWGATAHDADTYDVTMTETTVGSSGHYVGDFDASGNIAAGTYRITIYKQAGASPADTDLAIAQAEIYWNGTVEIDGKKLSDGLNMVHNEYDETKPQDETVLIET